MKHYVILNQHRLRKEIPTVIGYVNSSDNMLADLYIENHVENVTYQIIKIDDMWIDYNSGNLDTLIRYNDCIKQVLISPKMYRFIQNKRQVEK